MNAARRRSRAAFWRAVMPFVPLAIALLTPAPEPPLTPPPVRRVMQPAPLACPQVEVLESKPVRP